MVDRQQPGAKQPVTPGGQTRVLSQSAESDDDGGSEFQVELRRTVNHGSEVFFPGTVHARDKSHAEEIERAHTRIIEGEAVPIEDYSAKGGRGLGQSSTYRKGGKPAEGEGEGEGGDETDDEK